MGNGKGDALEARYAAASPDALERRMWLEIWDLGAPSAVREQGIRTKECGPVLAMIVESLPFDPMFNLVLGSCAPSAVEGGHLGQAIEWVESFEVDHYVPLTPGLAGASLAQTWLAERGYVGGRGRVRFLRDGRPPDFPVPEGFRVREVDDLGDEGKIFALVVGAAYDLPPWAATFFYSLVDREGWRCYMAETDRGKLAAGSAMRIYDGIAELSLAINFDSSFGPEPYLVLLRRQIADAIEAGCHTLFAATNHEPVSKLPSNTCRSLRRAGFREMGFRPSWRPRWATEREPTTYLERTLRQIEGTLDSIARASRAGGSGGSRQGGGK